MSIYERKVIRYLLSMLGVCMALWVTATSFDWTEVHALVGIALWLAVVDVVLRRE